MGLTFTKLFGRLFGKKEIRILLVGLDAAGKTSILNKLKPGKIMSTMPTVGYNVEEVEYKNIRFTVFDFGGSQIHPALRKYYFSDTRGVVFVVDSSDRDRIVDARDYLHGILSADDLKEAIFLVFANKQDLPNAMNIGEMTEKLDLRSLQQRFWYIQGSSAISGEGLYKGLDWLSDIIAR